MADTQFDEYPLEIFQDDPDLQRAAMYTIAIMQGKKKPEIAELLGISRSWLYELEGRWAEDGTLKRVRQELLMARSEAIQIASDEVLREWPEVVREALHIARHGKSERVRLEAMEWLHQRVVVPALADREEKGSKELAYANSDQTFNPLQIPDGDVQVVVETRTPTVIRGNAKRP